LLRADDPTRMRAGRRPSPAGRALAEQLSEHVAVVPARPLRVERHRERDEEVRSRLLGHVLVVFPGVPLVARLVVAVLRPPLVVLLALLDVPFLVLPARSREDRRDASPDEVVLIGADEEHLLGLR